jgi:hypothetical protein
MYYPDYLIHFNKNHSSKNGQFISGDGDGDGQVDDRHNGKKNLARRYMDWSKGYIDNDRRIRSNLAGKAKKYVEWDKGTRKYRQEARTKSRPRSYADQIKMAKKVFSDKDLSGSQKAATAFNSLNYGANVALGDQMLTAVGLNGKHFVERLIRESKGDYIK